MIGRAVLLGWRFPLMAWRAAWPWLLVSLMAAGGALEPSTGAIGPVLRLIVVIATMGAWARVIPLSFGRSPPAGFVAARAAELRLAGALILTAVFLFLLCLLAFVILLCFAYAAAASGHGFVASDVATWPGAVEGGGRIMVTTVGLSLAGGLLWAALRVALAVFSTADEGKVRMIATWPLTRGRTGAILAAVVLAAAPLLAAVYGLGRLQGVIGPEGVMFGQALVVLGVWAPVKLGVLGSLYLDLRAGSPQALP